MSDASLSAIGIESSSKNVQPNWAFVIASFSVLLFINFGIVAFFIYLYNLNAAQIKMGKDGNE